MVKLHYHVASARGNFPREPASSAGGREGIDVDGASALVSILGCPGGIRRGPWSTALLSQGAQPS